MTHFCGDQEERDRKKDKYLKNQGLEVLQEIDSVMEVIYRIVKERLWI